jgi:hypothetical protein
MSQVDKGNLRSLRVLAGAAGLAVLASAWSASVQAAPIILLDDSFADGDRTSVNLPSSSPVYIGQTAANGSNSVTTGALNYVLPSNSLKQWTYFTSDNSAPGGTQPHNAVTNIAGAGSTLRAQTNFVLPAGATAASTSKNFRIALFFDPTDARVQSDVNSDGGGGAAPWTDAVGYILQMPLNSSSSGSNPLQLGKRTTSNSSLAGSSGAFSFAATGGAAYALAEDVTYTARLDLAVVSPTQLDVTATLLQGATVLSTHTVSDTGTAFGATAIAAGLLPGSQGIYTNFDQFFFRNSDNTQATELSFTNFNVVANVVPEPASLAVIGFGAVSMLRRTRRRRD